MESHFLVMREASHMKDLAGLDRTAVSPGECDDRHRISLLCASPPRPVA